MTDVDRLFDAEEVARVVRIDVTLVSHYAEIGLVTPSPEGYSEVEVAELRRARRLHQDLGLDLEAVEIVLQMARRIRELSDEIRRLESERLAAREVPDWLEAEWEECL
jgi:DNA-binding transcriptional MerR regulator